MTVLIPDRGPCAGRVYLIDKTPYVLGRSPSCDLLDVFSDDSRVSRHHARLVEISDVFYVEDLGSVNGTFVNGRRINTTTRLQDGDVLSICGINLRFFYEAPTQRDLPTPSVGRSSGSANIVLDDDEPRILSTIQISSRLADIGERVKSNAEKKLEALIQLLGSLGKSLDIDTMLDDLIKSLFDVFPHADRGFVVLAAGEQRQYVPRLVRYRDEGPTTAMRISRTIIDRVSRSKEAILSIDASSDERFQTSRSLSGGGIYSVMCAPLLDTFGGTQGVIQLDSTTRKQFDQQDLDLLASIAPQAAMALSHARIHADELERQAIERDLQLARKVQLDLLPDQPPQVDGYEFYSYYKAAYQVGGDYYDYVLLPGDRLAVIIADVCGKGISASLLMAKLSGELKFLLANQPTYVSAVARLNDSVGASGTSGTFVTLVLVVIDLQTHRGTIVNAGHMAPLLRRADGHIEEVGPDCRRPALGIVPGQTYEKTEIAIAAGDTMVMFTDGVTEATNAANELYGRQRLQECVRCGAAEATVLGENILSDVHKFTKESPQSDDICLVCVRRI
jgi:serine phosphatase RsbU (regulator of sigma subunit)